MNLEKAISSEDISIGLAHSKLILIGEHAVVHGQPAIAIPFPIIGVESIITSIVGDIHFDSEIYEGLMDDSPESLRGIVYCIEATLEFLNLPRKNLNIQVRSSIPPGKGLGSSASVAVAIVRSLFAYVNKNYTREELLALANVSETYAHGAPSGIDALTIVSNLPLWFEKGQEVDYIKPSRNFYFVVADTGRVGDTRTAVESVTRLLKQAPKRIQRKLNRIGEMTYQMRYALEKKGKNLLGQLLNEAQKELEMLGVSDAGLNKLIVCARQEGALGAKLTGAGNGGCIIALAENELHSHQLTEKLKAFGADKVWPFVLQKHEE